MNFGVVPRTVHHPVVGRVMALARCHSFNPIVPYYLNFESMCMEMCLLVLSNQVWRTRPCKLKTMIREAPESSMPTFNIEMLSVQNG